AASGVQLIKGVTRADWIYRAFFRGIMVRRMGVATQMCPFTATDLAIAPRPDLIHCDFEPSKRFLSRGLTLVEMLISLVCIILLMLAYTQLFSSVGARISDARSMIDLTNRMRSAAYRLRTDLAGHTAVLIPPQNPSAGGGYFEYIEGPLHDKPGENGIVDP